MQTPNAAVWLLAVVLATACCVISETGAFPQVLPPIPGYIPVFIHHGDMPPEDVFEYSKLFQKADQNIPPYVSVTRNDLDELQNCQNQSCLSQSETNKITPGSEESIQVSKFQTEVNTETSEWSTESGTDAYTSMLSMTNA